MNFAKYIGIGMDEFKTRYIDPGFVQVAHHNTFPLSIYTYGRKAVHENLWDGVTSKCRGIVVNRDTGEIVARPFEKFHNYGSIQQQEDGGTFEFLLQRGAKPYIWEKMDGFMVTAYRWDGNWYAASKGSFHSIHAKWATAELRRLNTSEFPADWTPVFEGLHPDLRIVVDYGKRKELVLLALIHNETGFEVYPSYLSTYAEKFGCKTPHSYGLSLNDAVVYTRNGSDSTAGGEEGYVLTWYSGGADDRPPYRLKLKFVEYLRLHRMVCGVSPKRIWEALASEGHAELDDYLNHSTPWFAAFTKKWVKALRQSFDELKARAEVRYAVCKETVRVKVGQQPYENLGAERKAWALEFQRPENDGLQSILFAMLDNKRVDTVIWKLVKGKTSGINPMVDAHNT